MLIDWFTVVAQGVNFLILILLLKRFLYGPIIRVMEAREERIARTLAEAEDARKEARRREDRLRRQEQAAAEERGRILAEARVEVEAWRERALGEARVEVERLRKAWLDHVDRERQDFLERLKDHIAKQLMLVGEKVLRDLADASLQQEVVRVFLEKLRQADWGLPLGESGRPVIVRSGFRILKEQAANLRRELRTWVPEETEIRFETAETMGIGIQLLSGDRKVSWDLEGYLKGLEREIFADLPRERT